MAEQKLGRDVFIALAAVGWADGNLHPDEADAIVRAATEEGLGLAEIAEIESATKFPVALEKVELTNLSKEDRLFIYAVAAWMTWLDGSVTEDEIAALAKLGDALKLPAKPREHADTIMREVAHQSEDIRPSRYDLPALRKVIGERLQEAQRLRSEQSSES
jgi:uncharacterized membrane protein YebE (DUF533 family)